MHLVIKEFLQNSWCFCFDVHVLSLIIGVCEVLFQTGEEGRRRVAEYPYLYQENDLLQSDSEEPYLGSPDLDTCKWLRRSENL